VFNRLSVDSINCLSKSAALRTHFVNPLRSSYSSPVSSSITAHSTCNQLVVDITSFSGPFRSREEHCWYVVVCSRPVATGGHSGTVPPIFVPPTFWRFQKKLFWAYSKNSFPSKTHLAPPNLKSWLWAWFVAVSWFLPPGVTAEAFTSRPLSGNRQRCRIPANSARTLDPRFVLFILFESHSHKSPQKISPSPALWKTLSIQQANTLTRTQNA